MTGRISFCASFFIVGCTAAQAAAVNVEGGLIVCIGGEVLESVAQDWNKPGCVFHCLENSNVEISRLRKEIRASECYGKVAGASFDGRRLPYINNLVNLIVIRGAGCDIQANEVEGVPAPYGTAVGPESSSGMPKAAVRIGDGLGAKSDTQGKSQTPTHFPRLGKIRHATGNSAGQAGGIYDAKA